MDPNNTLLVFSWLMAIAFALPAYTMLWMETVRMNKLTHLEYSIEHVAEMAYDFVPGEYVAESSEYTTNPGVVGWQTEVRIMRSVVRKFAIEEQETMDRWVHLMGCQLI